MQINALDRKFDEAIIYLQQVYNELELAGDRFELFPVDISLKTDVPDYVSTMFEVAETIRNLQNLKYIHRIFKLDDATKESLFQAVLNNDDTQTITYAEAYTVTSEDTFELIAQKFGKSWNEIADYNKLDSMDLTAGDEIYIPHQVESKVIFDSNRIPVFTLQQGTEILGRDLPDELTADTDGDLTTLDNEDTFVQGMSNIASIVEGRLPFYPTYGFKSWIGDDIPSGARDEWIKLQVESSFLKDARVEMVPKDEMTIERVSEGYNITCFIYSIRGINYAQISVSI